MKNAAVTWEDEENNRQVEFSVEYTIEDQAVEVRNITPSSVNFLRSEKGHARKIGVHTTTGRKMLANQFAASNQFAAIKNTLRDSDCSITA